MPLMSSERQVSSDDAVETIEQWFTAHNLWQRTVFLPRWICLVPEANS